MLPSSQRLATVKAPPPASHSQATRGGDRPCGAGGPWLSRCRLSSSPPPPPLSPPPPSPRPQTLPSPPAIGARSGLSFAGCRRGAPPLWGSSGRRGCLAGLAPRCSPAPSPWPPCRVSGVLPRLRVTAARSGPLTSFGCVWCQQLSMVVLPSIWIHTPLPLICTRNPRTSGMVP